MDTDRLSHLYQFILTAASQEDDPRNRDLAPIHLLKYAYLGDLSYAERQEGRTFTGAPWRFHHFGPWSVEAFQSIEPALERVEAHKREFTTSSGEDRWRWSLRDDSLYDQLVTKLPSRVTQGVKRAVHEFGNDTSGLLHFVYLTIPMLRAAPGELLDFGEAARVGAEQSVDAGEIRPGTTRARLSGREKRLKKERMERLRERVKHALNLGAVTEMTPSPPPRYDEIFWQGQGWLNELAGSPLEPHSGDLVISEKVWKSKSRRDTWIP